MRLQNAKWIWLHPNDPLPHHQTVVARKIFMLDEVTGATLAITADGWYRLRLNGEWVADGPCRSWPHRMRYDVLDVAGYLRPGRNVMEITARFFGIGGFLRRPIAPGLLAQLSVTDAAGKVTSIGTDRTWSIAEECCFLRDVPRVALQMESMEIVDARRRRGRWRRARELPPRSTRLAPRDVALLTRDPRAIKAFRGAQVVEDKDRFFTFPVARWLHPGLIEADGFTSMAAVAATDLVAPRPITVRLAAYPAGFESPPALFVNGRPVGKPGVRLAQGRNLLVVVFAYWGYHNKDQGLRMRAPHTLTLENPLGAPDGPWSFIPLRTADYHEVDVRMDQVDEEARAAWQRETEALMKAFARRARDRASLREAIDVYGRGDVIPVHALDDPHEAFMTRTPVRPAGRLVRQPEALIGDTAEATVVEPAGNGAIELCYDLATQSVGYWAFDLIAPAGTVVDLFAVEHIHTGGRVQHTVMNRNGFRYVCREGRNRFLSTKRRSGRYLFLTLRNCTRPVRIRNLQVIESTYPLRREGRFACSDPVLNRTWEISARTLRLCMEDTFTDCPLYEQTLWVGDARNEGLYAMTVSRQTDILRRCITLAADSLREFPITSCTAPTCTNNAILPAWSFLWVISVWDYLFKTGDTNFVRRMWPRVLQNLWNAEAMCTDRDLFSGRFWNMFDWMDTDYGHATVIHNSMFLVGAIDAARRCARALHDRDAGRRLTAWRRRMARAIEALWNEEKQAYPDSVHQDGAISDRTCVHTSLLALNYDLAPTERRPALLRNLEDPPAGMVGIGSPFVMQFLFEALEKAGRTGRILDTIRERYAPMLEAGATTVWELLPSAMMRPGDYPTRSHCHAWSSAPIYFLNRIVLGIRQTAPAAAAFDISPHVEGLDDARGATATPRGPVSVNWRKQGGKLVIRASAPDGVLLRFRSRGSHTGLEVDYRKVPAPWSDC